MLNFYVLFYNIIGIEHTTNLYKRLSQKYLAFAVNIPLILLFLLFHYRTKSGLNEVMSIDRIAEIKRKIMTRKRGTIKGDEDYNPEVPQVAVR